MNCTRPVGKIKRLVVKIGTALLTTDEGVLNAKFITKLAREVAELRKNGIEVVLVSSGAVGAGMLATKIKLKPRAIPAKQALAAIGQPKLMQAYEKCFSSHGLMIAQVLLTSDDINHRERFANARNALFELLRMQVIPVFNENDTVAVAEIKFGDNDELSAQVTHLAGAELLVILTDVDGLYDRDPTQDPEAKLIPVVARITPEVERMAAPSSTRVGTGGMITKLLAAKKVNKLGREMVIANGKCEQVLPRIVAGEEIGTLFYAQGKKMAAKKSWIAVALKTKGSLTLDSGAVRAIRQGGKSLLPSGVKSVQGAFQPGDCVEVCDETGAAFARGLVKYSAREIEKLLGAKSADIQHILGHNSGDEIIHRNELVLKDNDSTCE